jgi:hypothetical protein
MISFHQRQYRQKQEQIIFFPRKKNKELQEFKSKLFQTYIKTIFVFKMQDQDFKIHSEQIFLHHTRKGEKWENGHLKPLFV